MMLCDTIREWHNLGDSQQSYLKLLGVRNSIISKFFHVLAKRVEPFKKLV